MGPCFITLFDHNCDASFLLGPDLDRLVGVKPWEMVIDNDQEKVKASFEKCLKGEEDFHIARLRDGPMTNHPGQQVCAWLYPVGNIGRKWECPHPCVSVLVHVVVVPAEFDMLTRRERDVLAVLSQGKSPSAIAKEMNLAPPTVHTYLFRVRKKLGLEHLVQVSAWAVTYRDILPLKDL